MTVIAWPRVIPLPRRHDGLSAASFVRHAVVACSVMFMLASAVAQGPSVTLRTVQQSNAQLKYSRQPADRPGVCLELLRAVEIVDPGIRFEGLQTQAPLRRVEALLRSGEIDVFFCLLKTPEREVDWDYLSAPLYTVRHVVAQRQADARPANAVHDLIALGRRAPILVTRGTAVARSLRSQGFTFQEVAGDQEALTMLIKGRTDAVYGQDTNLWHVINELGLRQAVQVSASAFGIENQYVAVARTLPPHIRMRLSLALETLRRNGVLVGILNKYMVNDGASP